MEIHKGDYVRDKAGNIKEVQCIIDYKRIDSIENPLKFFVKFEIISSYQLTFMDKTRLNRFILRPIYKGFLIKYETWTKQNLKAWEDSGWSPSDNEDDLRDRFYDFPY